MSAPEAQYPKYPGCTVELSSCEGNAVAIFRRVRRALIRHLVDTGTPRIDAEWEGDTFQGEATAGDDDHMLITCHRWVTVV